jgi:excisionase family DNA binding protein
MGMLCEPKGTGPGSVNRTIKNSEVAKMEELITIQQVADYLKVDRFTVYRLVTQKRIPAFKVGGQWRFKQEMIDSWLMTNSNMSEQRPPSS